MMTNRLRTLIIIFFCIGLSWSLLAQESSNTEIPVQLYNNSMVFGDVELTNTATINTEELEFSPSLYQNGLVFTTARRQRGPRDGNINETFFELFYAELDGNGMPIAAEDFSIEMNSQVHEGPVTFSRDGKTIFFTRNNLLKGVTRSDSKGKVRLKVFKANKGGFDWGEVQELPFNSDEYDVMHPSLSPDGKWLFFTSNMPGSIGGTDIWVVSKDGDNYGAPINLGPAVNSPKNEAFPFIHESGALFFASNGLPGNGGYDLFKTSQSGDTWTEVTNLGKPFNSPKDDFGLIMNPLGTRGYFTSARAGGSGKDDIYKFEANEGAISAPTPDLSGLIRVYDKETADMIEGAEIRVFERTSDGIVSAGDLYDVILMPSREASNELVMKLIPKDAATIGRPDLVTDAGGESPYAMRPDKQYIFFISKEGYLTNEVIYSTTAKSGAVVVEIPLEQKKCARLTGILKDGRTGAILPNSTVRIMNTCNTKEEVVLTDAAGQFSYCLPSGCNYTLTGSKSSYTDGISTVSVPAGNIGTMTTTINLQPSVSGSTIVTNSNPVNDVFVSGQSIVLDKIYYDFNKSAIRTGAGRELAALASIMNRYPSMEIELISHTDSRGDSEYNYKLSRRRAESARRYLMAKGVNGNRILAIGKGELEPRNACRDGVACSEEEHQYNRRTEVKVLRVAENIQIQYGDKGPEVIDGRRGN